MIGILILSVLAALIIGLVIGFTLKKGHASFVQKELEKTKEQLIAYQDTVNAHVYKTHEIMENIYQQFATLQKHAQDYSVKLNLDTSKQSILQPKTHISTTDKTAAIPKDYAAENNTAK